MPRMPLVALVRVVFTDQFNVTLTAHEYTAAMNRDSSMPPENAAEAIANYTENVRPDPYKDRNSIEFKFRSRRFVRIQRLIETILSERGEAEILDLGGRETYWQIGQEFIEKNRKKLRFTQPTRFSTDPFCSGLRGAQSSMVKP